MLKWCWIVGVFSFHCVHCWDKLHAAWNSNAGTGVRVNIIIPWGKPPWFLRNLEKFFCHFPLGGFFWGYLEDAAIQLDITFAIQDAPTFLGPPGAAPPADSLIFWGSEERTWHSCGCCEHTWEGSKLCCCVPALSPPPVTHLALLCVPGASWVTETKSQLYIMGHWKQTTSYSGSG